MKNKEKKFKTISQEDLNAFEEINQAFRDDFVEPDSEVLELTKPIKGKIKSKNLPDLSNSTISAMDKAYIDNLIKKHVDQWLDNNISTIMRQILNSKIDDIKDAE